jgi:hypothetical protein
MTQKIQKVRGGSTVKAKGVKAEVASANATPPGDPYMVDVRDIHGSLLFRFNGRTGEIEILQKGKPMGDGKRMPSMMYYVNVKQLVAVGARNIFSESPVNNFEVNGVVVDEAQESGLKMEHSAQVPVPVAVQQTSG